MGTDFLTMVGTHSDAVAECIELSDALRQTFNMLIDVMPAYCRDDQRIKELFLIVEQKLKPYEAK